jgi:transcriptional regulator with XRE-family HTH domain
MGLGVMATYSPVGARRRVRRVLRSLRESKSLTQGQLAEAMDWSLSKVMRIENGDVTISVNDLRYLLQYLGITDREQVTDLLGAAKISRQRQQWWDAPEIRDLLTPSMRQMIQYEMEAKAIRNFCGMLVPGALQIPGYARAVVESYADELDPEMVAGRLESRERRRQQLINRPDKPKIYLLVDEGILLRQFGGAQVLADQLAELTRLVDDGRLLMRVIRFEWPIRIPMLGSYDILYLDDDGREDAEVEAIVYRESDLYDEFVEDLETVRRHRAGFDRVWEAASDEVTSMKLIEQQVRELRGG